MLKIVGLQKEQVPMLLKLYWMHQGDINWEEGLLIYETQILVPPVDEAKDN